MVEREDDPLCIIEYDAALSEDSDLIAAVGAALRLAVDRDRLETMVRAQVDESWSLPRGPVTFLYSDIQGSTSLLERLGSRYGDLLAESRRIHRAVTGGERSTLGPTSSSRSSRRAHRPRLLRSRSIGGSAITCGPMAWRSWCESPCTRASRRSATRATSGWTSTTRRASGRPRTAARPSSRRPQATSSLPSYRWTLGYSTSERTSCAAFPAATRSGSSLFPTCPLNSRRLDLRSRIHRHHDEVKT